MTTSIQCNIFKKLLRKGQLVRKCRRFYQTYVSELTVFFFLNHILELKIMIWYPTLLWIIDLWTRHSGLNILNNHWSEVTWTNIDHDVTLTACFLLASDFFSSTLIGWLTILLQNSLDCIMLCVNYSNTRVAISN